MKLYEKVKEENVRIIKICGKELFSYRNIPSSVRVDLYEVKGKVYVGEMTFYPGNGFNKFSQKSLDAELANLLNLPAIK